MSISFERDAQILTIEATPDAPLTSTERFLASLCLPGSEVIGEVKPDQPVVIHLGMATSQALDKIL